MSEEAIERLKNIANDVESQYSNGEVPIMILTSVSDEDRRFVKDNIRILVNETLKGRTWSPTLLTYSIIDEVYENYAEDEELTISLWRVILEYTGPSFTRESLSPIMGDVFRKWKLPVVNEGKKCFNTILLNSSSIHYSEAFFTYISGIYENLLEKQIDVDLDVVARNISEDYARNPEKLTNSFSYLVKDYSIFRKVLELVLNKLDQRRNGRMEYNLGRWEDAFNDWYTKAENAKLTRKGDIILSRGEDGYRIRTRFPRIYNVPQDYSVEIRAGKDVFKPDVSIIGDDSDNVAIVSGWTSLVPSIDIFSSIEATDSSGATLFTHPPAEFRFFSKSGRMLKSFSSGKYTAIIKRGVKHDLDVLYEMPISDDALVIETRIEANRTYNIGDYSFHAAKPIPRNSILPVYPAFKNSIVEPTDSDVDRVLPAHPVLLIDEDVDSLRVTVKDNVGNIERKELSDVKSGTLDLNDIIGRETGVYRIGISHSKHKLLDMKYTLLPQLSVNLENPLAMPAAGEIPYTLDGESNAAAYQEDQMWVEIPVIIFGKEYPIRLRTPSIFLNPDPGADRDYWIPIGQEGFDANQLGSTIGISPGCVPAGDEIGIVFHTSQGTHEKWNYEAESCRYFEIDKVLEDLIKRKASFGIDLIHSDQSFPILSVTTLGKYDIDIKQKLVAITPYYMPVGCRTRYTYSKATGTESGYLSLGRTKVFDIQPLRKEPECFVQVIERNLYSGNEIEIYRYGEDRFLRIDDYIHIASNRTIETADQLLSGNRSDSDEKLAINILQELSDGGNKEATLKLARFYLNRGNTKDDYKKSLKLFQLYLEQ